jgi:uncharacterized protein (TIGR03083 family)
VLRALRASQLRLAELVGGLDVAALEGPSYDDDWSIADVLSHLGSQAEIFMLFVDAGLAGAEPPSNDLFGPIWDIWNAKSPQEQATDSLALDADFLASLEALDGDQLAAFKLSMFGMELDAARLLGMRLGEHALHTWDIAVVFDEDAVLAPDTAEVLVDDLGSLVARAGKAEDESLTISIAASSPERRFVLDTAGVSLVPGDENSGSPQIDLTSEALVRLAYGRLDDRHLGSPVATATGIELDRLRAVFPGF